MNVVFTSWLNYAAFSLIRRMMLQGGNQGVQQVCGPEQKVGKDLPVDSKASVHVSCLGKLTCPQPGRSFPCVCTEL